MSNYIETPYDEYFHNEKTDTLEFDPENEQPEVKVEDHIYGINKPYRITIKAKISHDKD